MGSKARFNIGYLVQVSLVGVIGFQHFDWKHPTSSIGYWLGETQQGKGLMTKACKSLVSFGFFSLHLQSMTISCAVENTRSQRIAQRLGFSFLEETIKDKEWFYDRYVDHYIYTLTSSNRL